MISASGLIYNPSVYIRVTDSDLQPSLACYSDVVSVYDGTLHFLFTIFKSNPINIWSLFVLKTYKSCFDFWQNTNLLENNIYFMPQQSEEVKIFTYITK